jgi:arylsulfatase A-like enzyme
MKGEALRAYAQQLDRIVAAIAREHPDHLIVFCSPTAVVPPQLPANVYALAMSMVARDDPGADDGFVLVTGPGTAPRDNPPPAYAVDIVPTILFAAGLPVGRDMDGRVLTEAFDEETLRASVLSAIQTYEAERVVVRRSGM